MAGRDWIFLLLLSSALISGVGGGLSTTRASSEIASRCRDAEVYLAQDWNIFISCCEALYPNETCPIVCPCRNGAECFPNNRTCVCKPGWVGSRCQRSCRGKNNSTYGQDCERGCRCGPDATCDPVTGICDCIDPENCTARCPWKRYGPKCTWKCRRCKTEGCDHVTGTCTDGNGSRQKCGCLNGGSCHPDSQLVCRCQAGWTGSLCDVPCPSWFYGENCSFPCRCGDNSTCSSTTGLCSCPGGENNYSCAGRCPSGIYGPWCSFQCDCPASLTCNQRTGDCECTSDSCRHILHGISESNKNITEAFFPTEPTPLTVNTTTGAEPSTHVLSHRTARKIAVVASTTNAGDGRGDGDGGSFAADDSPAVAEGSPQRNDDTLGGGKEFYPSAPFWGVVSAIAILLAVVVVLLILILRRQISSTKSPLTRRTKIGRQDNVYETVEELGKGAVAEDEISRAPPPPLPVMFQRGGSARSSLRSFYHRPLSVHSLMPAMDAPLPASVAALVCNHGSAPPVPGSTSRRSLMAEWRPHNLVQETRAKSRSHSSLTDVSPPEALNGYNSVFVEDDYADPFDSVLPSPDKPNRSSGYFATLRQDQRRSNSRSGSPVTLRQGAPP